MITLNGVEITPTKFPDNTSQIWKIPNIPCEGWVDGRNLYLYEWIFDGDESEFLHLAQLKDLIDSMDSNNYSSLNVPYLPYARQDKQISNTTTFALLTFAKLLNSLKFDDIVFEDAHSDIATTLIKNSRSELINPTFHMALSSYSNICFPDKGAERRYSECLNDHNIIIGEKVRNQLTGEITGYSVSGDIEGRDVLIVDDLCDGGRTFIEAANALYSKGAKSVDLYTTHGIYSKGINVLFDAGIVNIFNMNGQEFKK